LKKLLFSCIITASLFAQAIPMDDEELRLIYNSFVYSKDLNHAYKIAKKALIKYPKSIYWHRKFAQIALWNNKSNESVNSLIYIYKNSNDTNLSKKIIKQLINAYQYEKALEIINIELEKKSKHTKKDIEKFINISEKVGRPEDAIRSLQTLNKKNPSLKYLSHILDLQVKTGDIKGAKKTVKKIKYYKKIDTRTALALSKYYYLQKDLHKAYNILLKVKDIAEPDNIKYFERLSDFAWYINDKENSLYASIKLYENKKAREADIERIYMLSKNIDKKIYKDIAEISIEKFGKAKIYIAYINFLVKKKDFDKLDASIYDILSNPNREKLIANNSTFWLIKADVDNHFKRDDLVNSDLKKSLELASSPKTKAKILWYLIDNHIYNPLAKIVKSIESQKKISPILFHPLSAAHLTLRNIDKSLLYFHKIEKNSQNKISLDFLYSEILAAQGKNEERKKLLKDILTSLEKKLSQNPKLEKDKKFNREYIQAKIAFLSPDKAENLIKENKNNLANKDYLELKMLLALKEKNYNKASKTYDKYTAKEPLLELEIAKLQNNKEKQKMLIKSLFLAVPAYEKIEITKKDNKMKKAIDLAKQGLEKNHENISLQNELQYLRKNYASKTSVKTKYRQIGDLKSSSIKLENFLYLKNGYGIISNIKYTKHKSKNQKRLIIKQKNDLIIELGLRKHLYTTDIETIAKYRDRGIDKVGFIVNTRSSINNHLLLSAMIKNSVNVEDLSDLTILGAKENSYALLANYLFNDISSLSLLVKKVSYKGIDNIKIGKGNLADLTFDYKFSKKYKSGVRIIYRLGRYTVDDYSYYIDTLLTTRNRDERIMPLDFNDAGINLYYGDSYSDYGTSWNPYINAALFYNKQEKIVYKDIAAGFTGSFSQNTLYRLGASYQNSINGLKNENYSIDLGVSFIY